MCALTGVISGPIQPGKGDPEVTGEHGNRKSVRHTPGLQLLHGRVHVLQGVGNEVLLLFLLMPTLHQGQASIKTACELLFTFSISDCSFFCLEKETTLGSHAVCFFENILCFMVFKGIL